HLDLSRRGADCDRLDRDVAIAAIDQPQRLCERRVRLAGDDPRAEATKRRDAVADMRTDVEDEIAALYEAPIQAIHRGGVMLAAIINAQRTKNAARGAERVEHGAQARRRTAASIAGTPRLRSAGGGACSSGSAPMPARIRKRPTEGHEVMTASGIESAGPAAMNSA